MLLAAQILAVIVLLLHVYFVLLETVLFRTRAANVFGIPKDQIEMRAARRNRPGPVLAGCCHCTCVHGVRPGVRSDRWSVGRSYRVETHSVHSGTARCAGADCFLSVERLIPRTTPT